MTPATLFRGVKAFEIRFIYFEPAHFGRPEKRLRRRLSAPDKRKIMNFSHSSDMAYDADYIR